MCNTNSSYSNVTLSMVVDTIFNFPPIDVEGVIFSTKHSVRNIDVIFDIMPNLLMNIICMSRFVL